MASSKIKNVLKKLRPRHKSREEEAHTRQNPHTPCPTYQAVLLQQSKDVPASIHPPTADDVFRYRYHYGVNLGGIFVLDKRLFPSIFNASTNGDSELDAVTA